jgi:nucleoside-diphosphate-sugar epimerase
VTKNIFVLGCSGEIGRRLTLSLLESGFIVKGIRGSKSCKIIDKNHFCTKLNLLNTNGIFNLSDFRPEIMIHCAWITTPNIFWQSPLNNNWVTASKNIIKEFEKCGGRYLIVASTCAEYSWTNEKLSETSKTNPHSTYGKAKLELLNWLQGRQIPFLWTRIFFQFGLNEPNGKLIPSLIDSILRKEKFQIQKQNDVRDFVYITDVVAIMKILICNEEIGIINIGTGKGISIRSITDLIAKKMDGHDLIEYESVKQPQSVVVSNPLKLLSVINGYKWTELDEAIIQTIRARSKNT